MHSSRHRISSVIICHNSCALLKKCFARLHLNFASTNCLCHVHHKKILLKKVCAVCPPELRVIATHLQVDHHELGHTRSDATDFHIAICFPSVLRSFMPKLSPLSPKYHLYYVSFVSCGYKRECFPGCVEITKVTNVTPIADRCLYESHIVWEQASRKACCAEVVQ